MSIPPDPVLLAALRWLEMLSHSEMPRVRALLTSSARYGDITPTQYSVAYEWLSGIGAVDMAGRPIFRKPWRASLFQAAILASLWFADADVLVKDAVELPEDAVRAADALGLDYGSAFAHIQAAWGKVDTEHRAQIGLAGEVALVELLRARTGAIVEHVALESDGFGYDISVRSDVVNMDLEVKSTTRKGRLVLYLSRNEFETCNRDPDWNLVVLRLDAELSLVSVATVNQDWIRATLPSDRHRYGRWESARLDVPVGALTPGIPALELLVRDYRIGVLGGIPRWPG
ncbi:MULTISPECIES: protein NO VEIN domain-containing protein [unclassified Rhodococcus (in: high G+C Gram-positive bacteria)]|uniref:protein NO VEIN domain-containing protein n=1 Tax=unclassified Rhodococcus (in: high G+C Gram-positive bacteria) TaxID=192944 RepID=UPI0009E89E82|nr:MULTISPECIES: DUF3883 domain-containing protein [unclassified Rhodococcus (in: high G+C Gram-positive bacteria)]